MKLPHSQHYFEISSGRLVPYHFFSSALPDFDLGFYIAADFEEYDQFDRVENSMKIQGLQEQRENTLLSFICIELSFDLYMVFKHFEKLCNFDNL